MLIIPNTIKIKVANADRMSSLKARIATDKPAPMATKIDCRVKWKFL